MLIVGMVSLLVMPIYLADRSVQNVTAAASAMFLLREGGKESWTIHDLNPRHAMNVERRAKGEPSLLASHAPQTP